MFLILFILVQNHFFICLFGMKNDQDEVDIYENNRDTSALKETNLSPDEHDSLEIKQLNNSNPNDIFKSSNIETESVNEINIAKTSDFTNISGELLSNEYNKDDLDKSTIKESIFDDHSPKKTLPIGYERKVKFQKTQESHHTPINNDISPNKNNEIPTESEFSNISCLSDISQPKAEIKNTKDSMARFESNTHVQQYENKNKIEKKNDCSLSSGVFFDPEKLKKTDIRSLSSLDSPYNYEIYSFWGNPINPVVYYNPKDIQDNLNPAVFLDKKEDFYLHKSADSCKLDYIYQPHYVYYPTMRQGLQPIMAFQNSRNLYKSVYPTTKWANMHNTPPYNRELYFYEYNNSYIHQLNKQYIEDSKICGNVPPFFLYSNCPDFSCKYSKSSTSFQNNENLNLSRNISQQKKEKIVNKSNTHEKNTINKLFINNKSNLKTNGQTNTKSYVFNAFEDFKSVFSYEIYQNNSYQKHISEHNIKQKNDSDNPRNPIHGFISAYNLFYEDCKYSIVRNRKYKIFDETPFRLNTEEDQKSLFLIDFSTNTNLSSFKGSKDQGKHGELLKLLCFKKNDCFNSIQDNKNIRASDEYNSIFNFVIISRSLDLVSLESKYTISSIFRKRLRLNLWCAYLFLEIMNKSVLKKQPSDQKKFILTFRVTYANFPNDGISEIFNENQKFVKLETQSFFFIMNCDYHALLNSITVNLLSFMGLQNSDIDKQAWLIFHKKKVKATETIFFGVKTKKSIIINENSAQKPHENTKYYCFLSFKARSFDAIDNNVNTEEFAVN